MARDSRCAHPLNYWFRRGSPKRVSARSDEVNPVNSTGPRVRFAPSPTGYLHVGGARTALFNWLFARHEKGAFILRVEDTDVERNRPELVDGIIESLRWLGLDWDEGPYFQSQRLPLYSAAAEKLLASDAAYLCYCAPERYAGGDAAETDEPAEPVSRRITRCVCRDGHPASTGQKPAIRFRVKLGETTSFEDVVFGHREVVNEEIEDFVLLRSPKDGSSERGLPTYQLGAVVDDIDMRITHVIRGADHLSNTPKQALIYKALGAPVPLFAHVPLILGADRTRLSKRHGATSVSSYRDEGFLPEAFRNFLSLLGWSAGDNTEFMRTAELLERFSLEGVSRTNAVFDRPKLEWYNQQYLQRLPIEGLLPEVRAELERAGIWRPEWAGAERAWFAHTVDMLRPRTRLLPDFSHWARAFFSDDFEYDQQAKDKFWKDERLGGLLAQLADAVVALPEWNHDACEHALRGIAEAAGVKAGLVINATRVAIVGQAVAPPLFETMLALGRERVITRLRRAIAVLPRSAG
jgi:glutamyl-tRNA synthetase